MNRTPLFFCFMLILALSCTKSEVNYETIRPLEYFPVYPGSYWKYQVITKHYSLNGSDTTYILTGQDTAIVTDRTSNSYGLHSYVSLVRIDPNTNKQIITYSNKVYVPFLNDKPIYGYNKIDFASKPPSDGPYYKQYPFLSESVGFEFIEGWYDGRFPYIGAYYVIKDKIKDNQGDSLINVYGYRKTGPWWSVYAQTWKTYKKGVGLTLHYEYDTRIKDTIYKQKLIEYKINR